WSTASLRSRGLRISLFRELTLVGVFRRFNAFERCAFSDLPRVVSRRLISFPDPPDRASSRLNPTLRKARARPAVGPNHTLPTRNGMSPYPPKRTCAVQLGMSALGHKRT